MSVGLVDGAPFLDLDYGEDSRAQVDMNVVGTKSGGLVEVQGTAEGDPFPRSDLDRLLDLAAAGLDTLFAAQTEALSGARWKLVVATRSEHKMSEIREILRGVPNLTVLDLDEAGVPPDPAEEGIEVYDTFEENALAKARHFLALTGLPDGGRRFGNRRGRIGGSARSPLETVRPPGGPGGSGPGRPRTIGTWSNASRRFRLASVRRATCAWLSFSRRLRPRRSSSGVKRRGSSWKSRGVPAGSGTDPHVLDQELGITFAEMSAEQKNARSHRGAAFRALARRLQERLA